MVYLDDFDVNLIKIVRRESRIDVDIYYIGYVVNKPQYDVSGVGLLCLIIRHLFGRIEKIEGSNDRYLIAWYFLINYLRLLKIKKAITLLLVVWMIK